MKYNDVLVLCISAFFSLSACADNSIAVPSSWESTTESCISITSLADFLYQGQISTFWNLSQNGSSSTSQLLQGKGTFKQVSTELKKSLIAK